MTYWDPEKSEADRLVDQELDKATYAAEDGQLVERVMNWFNEQFARIDQALEQANPGVGLSPWIIAGVAAVIVIMLVLWLRPSRIGRAKASENAPVEPNHQRTPDEYLAAALDAQAQGDYALAYAEGFRALVRTGALRGAVTLLPSTTATTAGAALSAAFPHHAPALGQAANNFNQIIYGHLHPDAATTQELLDLAQTLDTSEAEVGV